MYISNFFWEQNSSYEPDFANCLEYTAWNSADFVIFSSVFILFSPSNRCGNVVFGSKIVELHLKWIWKMSFQCFQTIFSNNFTEFHLHSLLISFRLWRTQTNTWNWQMDSCTCLKHCHPWFDYFSNHFQCREILSNLK